MNTSAGGSGAGSLALFTDLYQLTMLYGYHARGMAEREAVFYLSFRKAPFAGGYTIAAGLETAIEYLRGLRFTDEDVAYLGTLRGADGEPLFADPAFFQALQDFRFTCDVDAVPEGTVVFPHEPLVRVRGPLGQAQVVETALLNTINFQTLIATKAARVVDAADGDPVLEFGLRRAQGFDGGMSASRAAFIGGVSATSNVLAGRLFGIPVGGTHAHSWVMAFDTEPEAFRAYAEAMPNNAVFLVDTYDTLRGVRIAIRAGGWMRRRGHEMIGIRLDSGDLAYLSGEGRRMLDEAGFPDARIYGSNDLDEHTLASLKAQGAPIGWWGVGTRLVTGHGQPALGGVYKLAALRDAEGRWTHRLKLSEQLAKISVPGVLQVRRFERDGVAVGDMIFDELHPPEPGPATLVDPADLTRRKRIAADSASSDLLVPVLRSGKLVYEIPSLEQVRTHRAGELARFHPTIRRLVNPHEYPVGLERGLHRRWTRLVLRLRRTRGRRPPAD